MPVVVIVTSVVSHWKTKLADWAVITWPVVMAERHWPREAAEKKEPA